MGKFTQVILYWRRFCSGGLRSILFQSACTGYVRLGIRGVPNGMEL